jgi:2,4-dienoyl-CoA reductase-like NADH-dependent reductase (Old Yellow Enzyme family)
MTPDEIEGVIRDFGAAAARAREAGFDAVQLHGAHGYLLSQFLSPLTNRRTDVWGGNPENRCRFHLEVIRQARIQAGRDFPLLIKLGVMDDDPGGTTLAEGVAAARMMVAAGVDAIEVSAGIGGDFFRRAIGKEWTPESEKPYFRDRAAALKRSVPVPVALVGGIRSLQTAQAILAAGEADILAMSRPFIREPGLVRRWTGGDQRPARCIACNQCYRLLSAPEVLPSYCWQESRSGA